MRLLEQLNEQLLMELGKPLPRKEYLPDFRAANRSASQQLEPPDRPRR